MDSIIKSKIECRTQETGWVYCSYSCSQCGRPCFINFNDLPLKEARQQVESKELLCSTCSKPDRSKRLKFHKLERDNKMVINKGLSQEQEIRILEREFKEKEIKDAEKKKEEEERYHQERQELWKSISKELKIINQRKELDKLDGENRERNFDREIKELEREEEQFEKSKKIIGSKLCTDCGMEKPLTEFNKNNKNKDGLHYWCKECLREYKLRRKERRKKNLKS